MLVNSNFKKDEFLQKLSMFFENQKEKQIDFVRRAEVPIYKIKSGEKEDEIINKNPFEC
jgi:hypothetical protein